METLVALGSPSSATHREFGAVSCRPPAGRGHRGERRLSGCSVEYVWDAAGRLEDGRQDKRLQVGAIWERSASSGPMSKADRGRETSAVEERRGEENRGEENRGEENRGEENRGEENRAPPTSTPCLHLTEAERVFSSRHLHMTEHGASVSCETP
ncbi:unnamed protein product [Lota lota]